MFLIAFIYVIPFYVKYRGISGLDKSEKISHFS